MQGLIDFPQLFWFEKSNFSESHILAIINPVGKWKSNPPDEEIESLGGKRWVMEENLKEVGD